MDVRVATCFHCGEPLPDVAINECVDGAMQAFCCHGCAAATAWIGAAALDDYYRLRSKPAGRVDADAPDFAAWDRDDVLAEHARVVEGGREITVLSDSMRCAACAWLIDRALRREAGVLDAGANGPTDMRL